MRRRILNPMCIPDSTTGANVGRARFELAEQSCTQNRRIDQTILPPEVPGFVTATGRGSALTTMETAPPCPIVAPEGLEPSLYDF